GGTPRTWAVGFSIGTKGYIGTGLDTTTLNQSRAKDFWEYNSITNVWTKKADFGGTGRYGAVGFSIGAKGYIGTGNDLANENDIIYDPIYASAFSIGNYGYVLTDDSGAGSDFGEYDPVTNTWVRVANLAQTRNEGVGFSIGNYGYIGTGNQSGRKKDLWRYT